MENNKVTLNEELEIESIKDYMMGKSTSQNDGLERELIKKHIENNTIIKPSIMYFLESGKVSGTFFGSLEEMMKEYKTRL